MAHTDIAAGHEIGCCPELETAPACDALDFHYRLKHSTSVISGGRPVQVEVLIHARFERCTGPMALGDLVYSTTLLPGEKVRLFTSDRRSRFSYDSASKVSYRHEQTSEERSYMASVHDFMSDLSVRDAGSASSSSHGSTSGHGDVSGAIETALLGPSVDVSGSYDSSSTQSFLHQLSQHASSSDHRSALAVRAASSVSVGEVQSRTHTEGESQDHFESSSREIANPNKCHAVTYYFYQINKTQTIKFSIEAIERRVIDPAADTRVTNNPFVSKGDLAVIPSAVLASDTNRLKIEDTARASVAVQHQAFNATAFNATDARLTRTPLGLAVNSAAFAQTPIAPALRARALQQVDQQLLKDGLIDKAGRPSKDLVMTLNFERHTTLPTPGLLVKGCLDECDVCEPELHEKSKLEIERAKLQNELLKRQIELLDQAQEYRCCPVLVEEVA
jgi:hypothetical protein